MMKVHVYDNGGYIGEFGWSDGLIDDNRLDSQVKQAAEAAARLAMGKESKTQAFAEPRSGRSYLVEVECKSSS